MRDSDIEVLPWPVSSPDMNPIETLWDIIKTKLRKISLTSKTQLINSILQICVRDNEVSNQLKESCRKLTNGMPGRIKSLIQAKVGLT